MIYLVSGIDTDIGKSVAAGMLARSIAAAGRRVITQKLAQTGDAGISMDIRTHRRLMQTGLLPEDRDGATCTEIFTFPASPHLAAKMENRTIDVERIDRASTRLAGSYDVVLLEGAGGLLVPLTRSLSTLDFAAERAYPVILVSSGRLGSLNHTLLSLEAIRHHGARLAGIIFNAGDPADPAIAADTVDFLLDTLTREHPGAWFARLPEVDMDHPEHSELEYVGTTPQF